ncbi:ComEC family competence protein [Candidatus Parcubacteria bacterium]|nr:ComEC family competence protein [Candidatus Parcubacteria bacterium]
MQGNALTFSCLGFLAGVVIATLLPLVSSEIYFLFLLGAALILLSLFVKDRTIWRTYLLIACFILSSALGAVRYLDTRESPSAALMDAIGHSVRIEGVMLEEPVQRLNSTAITLEVDSLSQGGVTYPVEEKVLVSSERIYSLRYGDRLRVEGSLVLPRTFETESGRTFDYPAYLSARGIYALVERPHLEVVGSGEGSFLRQKLYAIKNAFLEALARVLPEPESTLLAGLLLGSQGALPQEVQDSFRIAGLSHIVVLSGYNITLVADASMKALSFLPLLARLGAGSVAIILFVLMVGGGTAAVRAAIMAILVLLARATGRTYAAGRALLFAGTMMVILDPGILLGNVSFQLSFLATAGLIYGSPIFEQMLRRFPEAYGIKALATSTLSAQIFVLPLILYHSGILSIVALPANLLVLPSVPIAMLLGALLGGIALLSTALALPFALVAGLVLKYEISAAMLFAALPGSYLLVPEFSSILLVAVYALGTAGLLYWHSQRAMPEETRSELALRSS